MNRVYHLNYDKRVKSIRLKEDPKSEGYLSGEDQEFQENLLPAIQDKEDATSNLSSLPSETDEKSVVMTIKSKDVHANQLSLVQEASPKQAWNTQKI